MKVAGNHSCLLMFALAAHAQTAGVYSVNIPPRPPETFAAPCRFELTVPAAQTATRAVLVIYDRGGETRGLYDSAATFHFAERHRLALLWARHCPSAEAAEIDVLPQHGLGRALFSSLDELAQLSRHGELTSSKLILLGFDRAGTLAAIMPGFAPGRVLAAVVYAATGIESVQLPPAAAAVPQLVIANSADTVAGTRQPYRYFDRHFANGAPWVFAIQNAAPHDGGFANSARLVFNWIEMLLETTPDTTAPVALASVQRTGWWLFVQMRDTEARDAAGQPVARASDAKTEKVGSAAPAAFAAAGWVPSKKTAGDWQAFVRKSSHPLDPKY